MHNIFTILVIFSMLAAPLAARDAAISGDYLEVRTSDVYVGPCIANGEVNLTGEEAIMAWRVREGSWQGIPLQGLSVVAVVKANATLGDPFASPYPAESAIIVDQKATSEQRQALVNFARSMGGDLLEDVVWVKASEIDMGFTDEAALAHQHHGAGGHAYLDAGKIAQVQTRSFRQGDHLCGNEELYYQPLTEVSASPAYTLVHRFSGQGLGGTWSSPSKASAFVGTFAR
ncbi:MAG: DUF1326 domain-containing protein [Acidobacteriota bacterium]